MKRLLHSLLFAFAATLAAQDARVAVRAARMVDVEGGKIVPKPTLLIENGRIAAVNEAVPDGVCVIDLGDATLLPGLIDAHTHLLQNYDPKHGGDGPNLILTLTQLGDTRRALLGVKMAGEMLDAGFTTVRDLGNSGTIGAVALRDAIRSGWVTGPRIYAATRALSPPGGQFDRMPPETQSLIGQEYAIVNSVDDARRETRQALYDGADWIKVIVDNDTQMMTADVLRAICEEAHRRGRKVAAHAVSDESIRLAVEAGVDSIEHGYRASPATLKLMAEKKVALVPTDHHPDFYLGLYDFRPDAPQDWVSGVTAGVQKFVKANADRLAEANRAGVRIIAGADQYFQLRDKTRGASGVGMFRAYATAGMSNADILRATTIRAAEFLAGDHPPFGTLAKGKVADLIAVPGDPLADITQLEHVRFVMRAGKVVKGMGCPPVR